MKSLGIVRKLDDLGRIVIPKELRKTLDIVEKDALEIFTDGEEIILKKYKPGCHCCGELGNLTRVIDMDLCPSCLSEFNAAIKILEDKGLIKNEYSSCKSFKS